MGVVDAHESLRQRAIAEKDTGVLRTVGKTREEWIAQGRALGENEADRRGEVGAERDDRVSRAMLYAAWEWDGKPLGYGDRYQREFGTKPVATNGTLTTQGSDFKKAVK